MSLRSERKGHVSRHPGEVVAGRIKPRWWIRFTIGPTPVWIAITCAFLAVGMATFVLTRVQTDVSGQARDRHEGVLANVVARHDDCERLNNRLRHGLRRVVKEGEKQLPLIRHAFPGLPPEFYRKSYAIYALELRLFSNDDCNEYALEALPRNERIRIARELHY